MYEVRPSTIHGNGVFATEFIKKGTKLADYLGEEMTLSTFKNLYGNDISRTYSLRRQNKILNGKDYDNISHWMNESREPNVYFTKRAVYALQDIQIGQELFLKYPARYSRDYMI